MCIENPLFVVKYMLKTVLFGFMAQGYMSLRELEDNCRVNIWVMYLMDTERPSYRTFGFGNLYSGATMKNCRGISKSWKVILECKGNKNLL